MKITYVGNFEPTHSTETHLRLTLESMGHEVIRAQENRVEADDVERLAGDADLLMWTRTWGLRGDARGMLERVGARIPTVAYHLDLYAGLPRGEQVAAEPWWRCQYVFTPDGGSAPFWTRHNVNHRYLRPGVFDQECYLAPAVPELATDVLFVGSYGYHPEWPYRQRLINWLREAYGARFRLVPEPGKPATRGHELNQLYASAKVVVGDSLCLGFDHPRYWSDRIYETTGRGGAIIHPWIEGLDESFEADRDVVFYSFQDFDGLRQKIDALLANDSAREFIRLRGHERTKANHTYRHRLTEMFQVLKVEGAIS